MTNKKIIVKNLRKDGKLTAVYIFPLNGTRLTKIITKEQLEADQNNGYQIMWNCSLGR